MAEIKPFEELTKEEKRTVKYWCHCLKEVSRTNNIDLQYFINYLNESAKESKDEKKN